MRVRAIAVAVIVASCLAVEAAVAQKVKSSATAPSIGPVVGVNLFTFTGSDATGTKSLTAFAFGGAATLHLSPSVFLRPALMYSTKGATADQSGTTGKFKLNYVEAPVMLGFSPGMPGRSIRPYGMVGAVIGALASCKIEATQGSLTASGSCKDAGLTTKTLNAGLSAGVGLDITAGAMDITIGGRYEVGLTQPFDGTNVKNSGVQISVGVQFPLSH